jgi:hypothetical protein
MLGVLGVLFIGIPIGVAARCVRNVEPRIDANRATAPVVEEEPADPGAVVPGGGNTCPPGSTGFWRKKPKGGSTWVCRKK